MLIIPGVSNVRGILAVSVILIGLTIPHILNNTKAKHEYEKRTGRIEYLELRHANRSERDRDRRYLKIESYPYEFEVYIADNNNILVDNLNAGDRIDVYFYETSDTKEEKVNKFIQFIDKDGNPYFV